MGGLLVLAAVCSVPQPAFTASAELTASSSVLVQDTGRVIRQRIPPEARRRLPPPAKVREAADSLAPDSLAAGPRFPDPDSIMQMLMQREGYRPVMYRGDTLLFSTGDRSLHIRQRANIERAGETLRADSVVYDGNSRYVIAYGKSKLINAKGEEVDSEDGPLFYHTDRRIGTVVGGRTKWEVWNVAGDFTLEGSDTLWVRDGILTSCDLPEPHYHFEADKIKLVLGHIVVAWPVRLYFGDVPVFWFPFMAQDIRQGRRSGILTPRFGVNDVVRNSRSHRRHVSNLGYYWAINDYMDAQLRFDWWSSTWTRIDGFYRYRWRRKFIDGRFGYSQFFLPGGDRQMSLVWNHSQKFGERSDLRAAVQFVSSQQFQRENEFNPERLVQQIRSDVGFTRRFDWGTLNLSGQRVQPLTEGVATTLDFPQVSLTLTPLVLTPARSPLEAKWFNGLTWTGSANFSRQAQDQPDQPDRVSTNSGLTSAWSLGNLRWNSSGSYRELVVDKPDTLAAPDTTIVGNDTTITDAVIIGPEVKEGTLSWRTSVGYQQRLVGSTTLTPAIDFDGSFFRSNETDLSFISGPTRISVNATLNSDVFGFFPGVGPVRRIRHKFSPSVRWTYSPEVTPSPRIAALRGFSAGQVRERHQISFGLTQTFEAKLKAPEVPEEVADSLASRQPPEERKMTLLAVRTTALTYDFVEGEIITDRISNNITSDLLRGLTIRVAHDLFDERPSGRRKFDPFLAELNLNFSIGERTFAGLFGAPGGGIERDRGILPQARGFEDIEEEPPGEEGRGERSGGPRRPWSLAIDYSLVRSRPVVGDAPTLSNRQSIRANLGFSPTENWTISWRTQFDLEENEFVDHVLSLRRDLHRWSATFDFLRAANRNFLFEFAVHLNDMPDIKFDYRQETRE